MAVNYRPAGSPKPEPIKCPICKKKTKWEVDVYDGDWVLSGEWWEKTGYPYLCSRKCWEKA